MQASILVVTADASEDQTMAALLSGLGNASVCTDALAALQQLEQSAADIMVTQQNMADMSGVEFAESVREIEANTGNFSYILVVSDVPPTADDGEVFDGAVNQWILKAESAAMLPNSVRAALQMSHAMQELRDENAVLQQRNDELEKGQLHDPTTGLGNRRTQSQPHPVDYRGQP